MIIPHINGLFIQFYLDEDIDVAVGKMISAQGGGCVTARDAGMLGRADPDQLAYAAARGLAIVTHNRGDFAELADQYADGGLTHGGIVLAFRRPPRELADRLLRTLNSVTADEMRDNLIYL